MSARVAAAFARWRGQLYEARWLHRFALWMGPAGLVAMLAVVLLLTLRLHLAFDTGLPLQEMARSINEVSARVLESTHIAQQAVEPGHGDLLGRLGHLRASTTL